MDKTTFEIIRHGLYSIAREMKLAMMRTAVSPIIHSGGDASAAIFDAKMQLVAQGNDIPTMLGSAVISTKASVEAIGVENLRPGDVIASNDVYLGGGNHQPDVQLTRPVFHGDEIIAYAMTRGHWLDIGGASPGSFSATCWDIHAEGLRIPPVLLFRDNSPVQDMLNLITENTRDGKARVLDIKAQYAGGVVGEARILEMVERYGKDDFAQAMADSLDYAENLMRARIREIPDGVYEGGDFIEPLEVEGSPNELIPIKVKVTVKDDTIAFDYAGTARQVRGGINCPYSVTCNSTWFTVKAIADPSIPINQGCYRPITINVPEGSILNCTYPAPVVSGNTDTSPRIIDMLLATLSQVVPDRVIAESHASGMAMVFSGEDPNEERCNRLRRKYVLMLDVHPGGLGARPDKDGVSAIRVHVGNTGSQSIEMIEHVSPLTVEEWTIVADTGGAGRWRGGCAARRVYRVGYHEATLAGIAERAKVAPKGLFGGKSGTVQEGRITSPNGDIRVRPGKGPDVILHLDDKVSLQAAGSGGYGDPLERQPERVLDDVLDGYISAGSAFDDYGVVLSGDLHSFDADATVALRHQMRQQNETAG